MKKIRIFLLVLVLCALITAAIPMNACARDVTKVTPSKGKAGKTAIIHGNGLKGDGVTVKFGEAKAENAELLNEKTIKVTIPEKDPRDPDPVPVSVWIDGIPVPGEPIFVYKDAK